MRWPLRWTAFAVEVLRHLEPYLQRDAVPATRGFEEREAPLQLLVAGRKRDPDPDSDFRVRLQSAGQGGVRVVVNEGTASLAWAVDEADEPSINIDRAARHVFIWGRRPDYRGQIRSHLSQPDLARLQALLSGY